MFSSRLAFVAIDVSIVRSIPSDEPGDSFPIYYGPPLCQPYIHQINSQTEITKRSPHAQNKKKMESMKFPDHLPIAI